MSLFKTKSPILTAALFAANLAACGGVPSEPQEAPAAGPAQAERPDTAQIRASVDNLMADLQIDASLRDEFASNPRKVLAERGLPGDLQDRLLSEMEGGGASADCIFTCICTKSRTCNRTIVLPD